MINIRFLEREEFSLVSHFYEQMGGRLVPTEEFAIIAAFDGDKLIGCRVFNVIPHTGPTYVIPEYRKQGIGHAMMAFLCNNYEGSFYAFPTNPYAVRLCQVGGLKEQLGMRIFRRG
jgi:GNAT superfamily N-acetyltransferase